MHEVEQYNVVISQARLKKSLEKDEINQLVKQLGKEEQKLPSNHTLLIIDAEAVAGTTHLKACIKFAIKSFSQKNNLARNLNTEIMLYLSGNRQISKAFPKVGITSGSKKLLMLNMVDISKNKQAVKQFDFNEFFKNLKITILDFQTNVENIEVLSSEKVLKNLKITDKEIKLYDQGSEFISIIEKLAIEKSALLNLEK